LRPRTDIRLGRRLVTDRDDKYYVSRQRKVARDPAVKGHPQTRPTIKASIVGAPAASREQPVHIIGKIELLRRPAALRPRPIPPTPAAKVSLGAMARRWLALDDEINGHDAPLDPRTATLAPEMVQAPGIGTGPAAEIPILAGDNPECIRKAAFARPDPSVARKDK
jgi:transposase